MLMTGGRQSAAATPAGVTPSAISITSGAVCTGASGGQSVPASITLPTPYVNNNVDVALLLDDTGSFSDEWSSVASTFSSVVDQLQAAAPSVTFGFGVSMFKDYGGNWTALDGDDPQTRPYILNQPIVTSATAGGGTALDGLISNAVGVADELPGNGGDIPEASLEGLYQLATGAGFDGDGNGSSLDSGPAGAIATQETPGISGDVPPFSSNVVTTSGSLGGIGWRPGALHIVIIATDTSPAAAFPAGAPIPSTITSANGDSEPSINFAYSSLTPGDNRTGYVANTTDPATNTVTGAVVPEGGATVQGTINALNALGIRVIGMGPGDAPTTAEGPGGNASSIWLSSMARLTGATDSSGNPLVFDTSVDPTTLASSIVSTIQTSAANPVNVGISASGEASGVSLTFSPSLVDGVAPGSTASTTVKIVGPGGTSGNGTFNINFTDEGSGAQLGSIPVTIACPAAGNDGTSNVWSGYVSQYPPNDPVSTRITIPKVTCNVAGNVSMWVGYDGWAPLNSNTVEQDGVAALCSRAGGTPSYYAWYELFKSASYNPFPNINNIPVSTGVRLVPGDSVNLFVDRIAPDRFGPIPLGRDKIFFSIYVNSPTDHTIGHWSQTVTEPIAFSPKYNSSECITEGSTALMPQFSNVNFTDCSAITDATSPSELLRVEMIRSGHNLTTTSPITNGNDFTVSWLASK